ncbi:hypothetical protein BDY21DRAFT_219814 [Lineolata rhizophorae]|uniref:Uncharacterized protein n=1 Tax=Lineolata rhizophorae TaxID=578093 RepID=A0A6A6P326_9PEZI|nr:hypothetical protein BDY21DRAFT_219814 [Lineolata rhizophorae]
MPTAGASAVARKRRLLRTSGSWQTHTITPSSAGEATISLSPGGRTRRADEAGGTRPAPSSLLRCLLRDQGPASPTRRVPRTMPP